MVWGYSDKKESGGLSWWGEAKKVATLTSKTHKEYAEKIARQADKMERRDEYFSGESITGFQSGYGDVGAGFFDSVAKANNVKLTSDDVLAAAFSNNVTTDHNGKTSVNEDLYGKIDYGPDGRTGGQIAMAVLDSIFEVSANATTVDPMAAFMAGTNGPLKSPFGNWSAQTQQARTDMYGNAIRSDGINDYVEMNGTRYNIGMDGSYRETDLMGNEIQRIDNAATTAYYANAMSSGDVGWGVSGWDAGNTASATSSFWGTDTSSVAATDIYGWGNTAAASNPFSSYTTYAESTTSAADVYGWNATSGTWDSASLNSYGSTNSGGGNIWGTTTETATGWWTPSADNNTQVAMNDSYNTDPDNNPFWKGTTGV